MTKQNDAVADIMSKEERSTRMSHIHPTSTNPELILRKAIWRLGFRYKVNAKELPGTPDIVLPKYHTVIFVHGCFWHGHKGCKTSHIPNTNSNFWLSKITRNQERDQEVWRQLEAKGWFVIIVWECQLKKSVLNETVSAVSEEIKRNEAILKAEKERRRESQEAYRKEQRKRKEKEARIISELNPTK